MARQSIFCNRCGFESTDDAQFCQRCGTGLAILPSPSSPQSPPAHWPHYAGFWIRVPAALLDFLLLFLANWPVRVLLGSAIVAVGMNAHIPAHQFLLIRRSARIALAILIGWSYRAGMESSSYQATLGKMAMRLKVTDTEGLRLSLGRATARHFAKLLSLFSLGIGYLMAGFDEQKQALHDRIAGTLVLYRIAER